MPKQAPQPVRTGAALQAELERRDVSVRSLSAAITKSKAGSKKAEAERRYLQKVIEGEIAYPSRAKIAPVAKQLGVPLEQIWSPRPRMNRQTTEAGIASIAARLEDLATRVDGLAGSGGVADQTAQPAPTALPAGLEGSVAHLLEWQKEVIADLGALDRRLEQLETRQAGGAGQAGEGTGS